ncbi:MAG: FGGY-family carbohydrate kinase [Candidatus Lokiarchaeota archaeon]|nr:FGGY-family carbohydrate kinase [Candidatus Lokiarchaeota archaeon]
MEKNENLILVIDFSSNSVKVGLVSEGLKLVHFNSQNINIINEGIDGFVKSFNMEDIWNKIVNGINQVLIKIKNQNTKILGISTCAQRIASVFLDEKGDVVYGGPNIDVRGIDSAYLIDDEFSEKDLFEITGHSPSLLFCLARLLWFREEEEETYAKISKVLMLDDWLVYRLSGIYVSDFSSAAESQLLDIKKKEWSSEIINTFDFNPDLFPDIVESGTLVGELKPELAKKFNFNQNNIPIVKAGGDTQATLLGMGVIEEGDIGISLGTTAPLHLVVDKPIIDPSNNYWTSCHSVQGKWLLEGNAGNTGASYNWFKKSFLSNSEENPDFLMDTYLKLSPPGALSTYAYLGPENMNIKNQTSIKRGVFAFQPPMMISEELPKIEDFGRSVLENIAFGILENYNALNNYTDLNTKTFCAGGMAKSEEFSKLLANVLDSEISIPLVKDSAFIGVAMNTLKALDIYSDYKVMVKDLITYEKIKSNPSISEKYKSIYLEWKNLKNKIDNL